LPRRLRVSSFSSIIISKGKDSGAGGIKPLVKRLYARKGSQK
jgi:hypothetical protein